MMQNRAVQTPVVCVAPGCKRRSGERNDKYEKNVARFEYRARIHDRVRGHSIDTLRTAGIGDAAFAPGGSEASDHDEGPSGCNRGRRILLRDGRKRWRNALDFSGAGLPANLAFHYASDTIGGKPTTPRDILGRHYREGFLRPAKVRVSDSENKCASRQVRDGR